MRRLALLFAFAAAIAGTVFARQSSFIPATPVITEPAYDNQVISAYDVHMVTGPFAGAAGETHVCSDWEIRTPYSDVLLWSASCVTGTLAVHIHLGDGTFANALAGHHQLDTGVFYKLRVRFKGDQPPPDGSWSDWAERIFQTAPATAIEPIVLSDVSIIASPTWRDASGRDVILPSGSPQPFLRLEVAGVGTLLEWTGRDGTADDLSNPPALSTHGPLHAVCAAGGAALSLPASTVTFTDGSGQDRSITLPAISLAPAQSVAYWISEGGGAFADNAPPATTPDFSAPLTEPPVPWAVRQPGFRVERFATNLQLPVDIAFLSAPGDGPQDPLLYVTELYGAVQLVTRSGEVSPYATNLLNFDPNGVFPGSGETGVSGVAVEPQSGDLFVAMAFAVPGVTDYHFPQVVRLHSSDGGRTASGQSSILKFTDEPSGASHQISNLSVGPDGKLYVHVGDGELTSPAEDLTSIRGKILRLNLDGTAPTDNPFYDAAGPAKTNLIFAYGLRNPFGGAWRAADGMHWEVENGPSVDRFARVVAGRNYLWDGTDASMKNFAAYNWLSPHAPVNVAFVQAATFGGSGFPQEKLDHAFVTESGPTYAPGPQQLGKRVSEFAFDVDGQLVSGPVPLIEYVGAGRGTAVGLASGPDGLYFTDLYKNFGAASPIERGASIFRIRYTGVADFAADVASGPAPWTVTFADESTVPVPSAWRWEFGDGTQSEERNPAHRYTLPGTFDVRLTVTGAGGDAVRQKNGFVTVAPPVRMNPCGSSGVPGPCLPARPSTRVVPPR